MGSFCSILLLPELLLDNSLLARFQEQFFCCCSVPKLCLTLCDPMDCSKPGSSVLHYLPEFAQIHVHEFDSQWCHPTISSSVAPFSSYLQSCPASGSFLRSQFFASSGQSVGVSASASVLPVNIQGWFSSGLIVLISLFFKGLSRVFSRTSSTLAFSTKHSVGMQLLME